MVIGHSFIWGHLPKTGGDATAAIFQLFPHLVIFADQPHVNEKHRPFPIQGASDDGKVRVANIRRLPAWVLSYFHHAAQGGIYPRDQPSPIPLPEQMANSMIADTTLADFINGDATKVDLWIKMESFVEDLLAFIASLTPVSSPVRTRVRRLGFVNAKVYDHEVENWFTNRQISSMYDINPCWATLEQDIYGGLWTRPDTARRPASSSRAPSYDGAATPVSLVSERDRAVS